MNISTTLIPERLTSDRDLLILHYPFSGKEFKHKLKSNFLKGPNMFEIYLGIYDGFIYIPAILIKKSLTGIFLYF